MVLGQADTGLSGEQGHFPQSGSWGISDLNRLRPTKLSTVGPSTAQEEYPDPDS